MRELVQVFRIISAGARSADAADRRGRARKLCPGKCRDLFGDRSGHVLAVPSGATRYHAALCGGGALLLIGGELDSLRAADEVEVLPRRRVSEHLLH